MMVHFDNYVSGAQIGDALAFEPEELIFALEALAEREDVFLEELTGYIAGTTAETVTAFLRRLADAIENRS